MQSVRTTQGKSATQASRTPPGRDPPTTISSVLRSGPPRGARDRVQALGPGLAETPHATVAKDDPRRWSWLNAQPGQLLPQGARRAEQTGFHGADRDTQRLNNLVVRLLLDEREGGNDLKLRRQSSKRPRDGVLHGPIPGRRRGRRRDLPFEVVQLSAPCGSQVIERHVRGDAPHPRAEAAGPIEPGSSAVGLPERLHDNVFSDALIADNPKFPPEDLRVKLSEERFERIPVALDEPPQNIAIQFVRHQLYLALLRGPAEGSIRRLRYQGWG